MPTRTRQTSMCHSYGTSTAPTLVIDREDFDAMLEYAEAACETPANPTRATYSPPSEVCGYAFVRRYSPSHFQLIPGSVFITTQVAGPGISMPDANGEVEAMDRDEEFDEDEPVYRILWHSHMRGEARFSSTDIRAHNEMATTTVFEAMFFLVLNIYGEATANFEQYHPTRIGTQINLIVTETRDDTSYRERRAEFVSKRTVLAPKPAKAAQATIFQTTEGA